MKAHLCTWDKVAVKFAPKELMRNVFFKADEFHRSVVAQHYQWVVSSQSKTRSCTLSGSNGHPMPLVIRLIAKVIEEKSVEGPKIVAV